jgi:hypothetical protein
MASFRVRRQKTAEEFIELYGKRFPKAVSVVEAGIGGPDLLTLPRKPPCPHTHDEHARAALSRGDTKTA